MPALLSSKAELLAELEAHACRLSFPRYLRSATIEDAHQSLIPFAPWPHLIERAESWQSGQSEVVLKGRQLGLSWLAAAYAAWKATHQPSSTVLLLSQGQREAYELLAKVRSVLTHHRYPVRLSTSAMGELSVAGGGRVIALPSTEDAGRGFTASLVITDEAAFHPYAERNYAAYRPAMADGGQLLVLSTANGASGWFHTLYWSADNGDVPLRAVFIPWSARPGRDSHWLERERAAYTGLPALFRQEYPGTPGEAFVAHSGLVYGLDAITGEPIFDRDRHVKEAPCEWQDCIWRIAAIDPGGADPTAVIPIGVSEKQHIHVYGEYYGRGPVGALDISGYLGPIHEAAELRFVVVDPSQSSLIATLRSLGFPAFPANNEKLEGIAQVSAMLRASRLTIDPQCKNLIEEFNTYWWAERRDMAAGGKGSDTRTPAGHHADALDALRYGVLGILKGLPGADSGSMEHRWNNGMPERPKTLKERIAAKRS